jgi:aspartyl protease family protein
MKAVWIILCASAAIYFFAPVVPDSTPAPVVIAGTTAKTPSPLPLPVTGEVTLARARDGHFYADALVNGQPVRFIVDTGATSVALTRADAARLGIAPAETAFTETAKGAGGDVKFKPVSLDRVSVGGIEARQVQAAVVQSDMAVSLLGQSWLKNVQNVTITRNTMTLH